MSNLGEIEAWQQWKDSKERVKKTKKKKKYIYILCKMYIHLKHIFIPT